jgi:hypothetical protein
MNDPTNARKRVADPVPWLLEAGEPWVRYRTLLDLLDRSEDAPEVEAARRDMVKHPQIRQVIEEAITWPGYPLKRHNDAQHPLHKLALLADFGLRADDPGMDKLIPAVMGRRSHEGAFQSVTVVARAFGGTGEEAWTWMLCDAPTVLYAVLSFDRGDQPAVQRAVEHLTGLVRDNGWPCAASPVLGKFRGPGRKDDPCPYANLVALKALAQVPGLQDSPAAHAGVEMLLRHWERRTETRPYLFGIGGDFRKLKYPFIWYDILHVTDVLSRFPFARQDSRLREMVKVILDKQDDQGRFTPESAWMAWKEWDFGQKRTPSPSLTLLVRRLLKRMSARPITDAREGYR